MPLTTPFLVECNISILGATIGRFLITLICYSLIYIVESEKPVLKTL